MEELKENPNNSTDIENTVNTDPVGNSGTPDNRTTADVTAINDTQEPRAPKPEAPYETGNDNGEIPEIVLPQPGDTTAKPAIELPPSPRKPEPAKTEPAADATAYRYRWTYGEELRRKDKKRRSGTGVLTYAIIMTVAFTLCFVTLLGVVLLEEGVFTPPSVRTIYVREYDSTSGVLTIPEIADKVKPSVVGITVKFENALASSIGTGIIMSEDGYIATNYHVIENGISHTVVLSDNTEYAAEVVGYDEMSDLALIKINASGLRAAQFGDSDTLIVGEVAVAIGTPAGLDYAGTVTSGIVSAINRGVKIYDDTGVMVKKMTLIQTSASVNPGNSGGPLVNEYGQVVGIISMKLGNNYDGIGFAIPINGAMTILNDIRVNGSSSGSSAVATKRALIGITAGGIQEGMEFELGDGTKGTAAISGVIVTDLTDGYDAKEKMRLGDIITEVDGKSVATVYDIMDIINNKNGGDTVTVKYYRDGVYNTVTITLGTEE